MHTTSLRQYSKEMVWWNGRRSERLFWNYCVGGTLRSLSEIWHIPDNPRTLMWAALCSLSYHKHLPSLSLCRKKLLLVQERLVRVLNWAQLASHRLHAYRCPHLWYTLHLYRWWQTYIHIHLSIVSYFYRMLLVIVPADEEWKSYF